MKAFINKSYIKSHIEDGEVIIDDLYVDPAARGSKMGYRLLDLVKDIARSTGHNMALYVNPDHLCRW